MITIADVKKSCNDILTATFPNIKLYGNDTTDGYERPAFFTEVLTHGYRHMTKNYSENGATFKVTLFEQTHDEAFCLSVYEKIREAFGMTLRVAERKILVGDISFDFIGEYSNMLQVSVDFDWMEQKPRIETEPLMEEVNVSLTEGE